MWVYRKYGLYTTPKWDKGDRIRGTHLHPSCTACSMISQGVYWFGLVTSNASEHLNSVMREVYEIPILDVITQ